MRWSDEKIAVVLGGVALVALCVFQSRRHYRDHNASPVLLDPDLSRDTRLAALAALDRETDASVLHEFAHKLAAAGHIETARTILAHAAKLPITGVAGSFVGDDVVHTKQYAPPPPPPPPVVPLPSPVPGLGGTGADWEHSGPVMMGYGDA